MAQPPETSFRIGSCVAKIWLNRSARDERSFRNVSFERTYRDEQGNWQSANTFTLSDLPGAIKVLQMALDHVAKEEAVVSG